MGAPGRDGANGSEGTRFLVTEPITRLITYGDGANVLEVIGQGVTAPEAGTLLVRSHVYGSVAKRDGATLCTVEVSLRQDQAVTPLSRQVLGVFDAPAAGRLEIGVAGTLVAPIEVTPGQNVLLHLETRRFDETCAAGGGPTRIAELVGRLEVTFHRQRLAIP